MINTSNKSDPSPTATKERIVHLDVLRGFALGGILLINITAFASPGGPPGLGFQGLFGDTLVIAGLILFVESKFFSLFSFLFGVGFAIQMRNTEQKQVRFLARYLRRLLGLGLFGIAHILLLWEGDILLLYAFIGFWLIFFRHVSDRGICKWIIGLLTVPLLFYCLGFSFTVVSRFIPGISDSIRELDKELLNIFANARETSQNTNAISYLDSIKNRLSGYGETIFLLLTRIPTVLAMFLLGLLVGRREILAEPGNHLKLLQTFCRWGLGLGLLLSSILTIIYFTAPPVTGLAILFFNQGIIGPLLGLGYAATWTLYIQQKTHSWVLSIAAVGRMALTNYLLQSVIAAILFWPIGIGLVGKIRPTEQVAIALLIYIGQIIFSMIWLRFFSYGPCEWLWRSFTYFQFPKILRSSKLENQSLT